MDEIRELLIRRMYATHKAEYHLRIDAMLTRLIESNTDPDFKRKCFFHAQSAPAQIQKIPCT